MLEIERKFLVKSAAYKEAAVGKAHIVQGFLNTHPERTVRIRIQENLGILTIKGKSNKTGTTRFEWEQEISKEDAARLLELCEPTIIEKIRFSVAVGSHVYEVDEFLGVNSGLVMAEIELKTENEVFVKPDWLGDEVTGRSEYYNSQLCKKPYNIWRLK